MQDHGDPLQLFLLLRVRLLLLVPLLLLLLLLFCRRCIRSSSSSSSGSWRGLFVMEMGVAPRMRGENEEQPQHPHQEETLPP